jgi:hypothetical protein
MKDKLCSLRKHPTYIFIPGFPFVVYFTRLWVSKEELLERKVAAPV